MEKQWWHEAVVYQIYPKSFMDTTGSGTGDLRGITKKLDYLKRLGVDVIWLTPVYKSPQNDNGYDISDYYAIDPSYGTMADFDELLKEAHARELKIVMDIVINHTSIAHEWFRKSRQSKDNPYRDFYIWRDGVDGGPPNNWQSKFGGSAWGYDELTDQYYLHLFDKTQADLNWESEAVRKELTTMMCFWAEKGIDGFRLDVINLISKDQQFPNDSIGDGRRFYTDGPRIHEYLHEMNQAVFKPYGLMTVGEMSSTTLDACIQYTNPRREELDMTFQFHHLKVDYPNGEKWTKAPFDFIELKEILTHWQTGMAEGNGWNALFWCNHDQPRIVSRLGDDEEYRVESAKMLATTIHMMNGTPYIYQGEEIGMTNPGFQQLSDYRDVESLNAYEALKEKGTDEADIIAILQQKSRDNARTPMQWSAAEYAGFTAGTPWIAVANNYETINVEEAVSEPTSIFYHYRALIALRKKYDMIVYGSYETLLLDHEQVFAYKREWQGEQLLVVSNFYSEEVKVDLAVEMTDKEHIEILISNYPDTGVDLSAVTLRAYESVVYHIS